MSNIPFVQLCFGAYESNGVIRHKTQRLHGIIRNTGTFKKYIHLQLF